MNDDDYDSGGDSTDGDDETVDSCEAYISFESTRDPSSKLEESISFSWPGIYDDDDDDDEDEDEDGNGGSVDDGGGSRRRRGRKLRKVILSTLLEEGDLSPLFDGATWAGTRLWAAAVRAAQYLSGRLPATPPGTSEEEEEEEEEEDGSSSDHRSILGDAIVRMPTTETAAAGDGDRGGIGGDEYDAARARTATTLSVLELGCGLGVPGMILHLMGCDVVLTDQAGILSQLERNVAANFGAAAATATGGDGGEDDGGGGGDDDDGPRRRRRPRRRRDGRGATVRAMPLSWSRDGARRLAEDLGRGGAGFDVVVNCDCVYEPLYGKR